MPLAMKRHSWDELAGEDLGERGNPATLPFCRTIRVCTSFPGEERHAAGSFGFRRHFRGLANYLTDRHRMLTARCDAWQQWRHNEGNAQCSNKSCWDRAASCWPQQSLRHPSIRGAAPPNPQPKPCRPQPWLKLRPQRFRMARHTRCNLHHSSINRQATHNSVHQWSLHSPLATAWLPHRLAGEFRNRKSSHLTSEPDGLNEGLAKGPNRQHPH